MKEFIYSRNAVYETLRAGRRQVFKILLAEGAQEKGRLSQILKMAGERKIPVQRVQKAQLERLHPTHQGVVAEVSRYPYASIEEILRRAERQGEAPFVLLLDSLQDPQNFGSLLRTAEVSGVHGVILPLAHAVEVTPAVVNASSGASEHLLIARHNLAQAIQRLKEAGLWIIGLEHSPKAQPPEALQLDGALGLVVGSEGEGLRPLVRASCDFLLKLPMRGQIESLNAAVAGSIALYLAFLARQTAKEKGHADHPREPDHLGKTQPHP
uniref:RNA methyltransferase, TrmH family n=1 Tax=uncultured Chloroflexota bacterium TaxID=166587 RepID=H5SK80_9CHLR|nr:RNA methyltransferase [uncultured bacterium]BAL56566.1 RNA methyltransferase, TrmH family [uncultured Chloroflexota bacterium]